MKMLDTNICSYVLRKRPVAVLERFYTAPPGELCISAVVAAEMRYGAAKLDSEKFIVQLERWLGLIPVVPWPESASHRYARLRCGLERAGTPIGNMDMLIAAHALAENAVLITNNAREFRRVPELIVENWA
jgi:tRNA(fMet)-specific endonuclease VapC